MALKIPSRTAQVVRHASFSWAAADTMVPAAGGTATDFKPATTVAVVYDIIPLPVGAVVLSGELIVSTAFDGSTYALIIGDSASTNRYLATADRKAAARTTLVPSGYVSLGEPLRVTITPTGTTTVGAGTIHIEYVIPGRADFVMTV